METADETDAIDACDRSTAGQRAASGLPTSHCQGSYCGAIHAEGARRVTPVPILLSFSFPKCCVPPIGEKKSTERTCCNSSTRLCLEGDVSAINGTNALHSPAQNVSYRVTPRRLIPVLFAMAARDSGLMDARYPNWCFAQLVDSASTGLQSVALHANRFNSSTASNALDTGD